MYGTQTVAKGILSTIQFENDVKMYGTQTEICGKFHTVLFENDVKMYGTQTLFINAATLYGLRMM